jgi:hypothetical protein
LSDTLDTSSSREEAELIGIFYDTAPTVLMVSKGLKTGRQNYIIVERLADKQLVVVHDRHYGTSYEAASPEVIEFLVGEQEREEYTARFAFWNVAHLVWWRSISRAYQVHYRGGRS